jgi:tRNA(Phe) wybutosine-synthesizing methylase Tyw3
MYQFVTKFTLKDKKFFQKDADIDTGIRPLVDAINSVKYFATMNACQGTLIAEEVENHCPKTYVDFYVLHHKYELGHFLFSELVNKFDDGVICEVKYEPDFNLINENEIDYNGYINLRFSLQINDDRIDFEDIYMGVLSTVQEFSQQFKI